MQQSSNFISYLLFIRIHLEDLFMFQQCCDYFDFHSFQQLKYLLFLVEKIFAPTGSLFDISSLKIVFVSFFVFNFTDLNIFCLKTILQPNQY